MIPDPTGVRAARDLLRFEITVDSGDADVYSWALDHALDIIELAALADIDVPAEITASYSTPHRRWEYLTCTASGSLLVEAWNAAVTSYGSAAANAAVAYWARVLTRYLGLPAVAALADQG